MNLTHLDLVDKFNISLIRKPYIQPLVEINLRPAVNQLLKQFGMLTASKNIWVAKSDVFLPSPKLGEIGDFI